MARYWIILVTVLWVFIGLYLLFTGKSLRPMLPFVSVATLLCAVGIVVSALSSPNR